MINYKKLVTVVLILTFLIQAVVVQSPVLFTNDRVYAAEKTAVEKTIDKITLDSEVYDMTAGEERQAVTTAVYSDGEIIEVSEGLGYESLNNEVFTVTNNGLIKGVKTGEADLIVNYAGFYAIARISVKPILTITGIEFVTGEYNLAEEGEYISVVDAVYSDGSKCALDNGVEYESSDEEVVTVSSDGILKGVGNGKAVVTAKYKNFTADAKVNVTGKSLPAPVLNLNEGKGTVILTWEYEGKADYFIVKKGTEINGLGELVSNINGKEYTDSKVETGKEYYYSVTTVKGGVRGEESNIVVRRQTAGITPVLYGIRNGNAIKLNWTSAGTNAEYNLYRSTVSGAAYEKIAEMISDTFYVDSNATDDVAYFYTVKAVDSKGIEANSSEEVSIRPSNKKVIKFNPLDDDDNDGLTNEEELLNATDKDNPDTDRDGKSDSDEVKKDKTNPLRNDRIKISVKKPELLQKDNGKKKGKGKVVQKDIKTAKGRVKVHVEGDETLKNAPLKAEEFDDDFLCSLKGVVGKPVDISAGDIAIDSAVITFSYSEKELKGKAEDNLGIYWVDGANGRLQLLKDIQVDKVNKTVSGVTTHFSIYVVGDTTFLGQLIGPNDLGKVDVVFAIDQSKGMDAIDPNYFRLKVLDYFAQNLTDLNDGTDNLRVGVVELSEYGEEVQGLTDSTDILEHIPASLMHSYGATNIADGLWVSKNMLTDGTRRKVIVLVTDGKDSSGNTPESIENLVKTFGTDISVCTIAVGSDTDDTLLQNIAQISDGGCFNLRTDPDVDDEDALSIYYGLVRRLVVLNITNPHIDFNDNYKGTDYEPSRKLIVPKTHTNMLTGNYIRQDTDIKLDSTGLGLFLQRTYNSDSGNECGTIGNGWSTNYDTSIEILGSTDYGRVTASLLNVRSEPMGTVITTVANGEKLQYIAKDAAIYDGRYWDYIRTSKGIAGYVASWYVSDITGVEVTYGSGTKIVFDQLSDNGDVITYTSPYGVYDKLIKDNGFYYLTRKDGTVYTYSDTGKLINIKDKYENSLTLSFNGDLINSIVDNVGRTLTFQYKNGKLWRVNTPPIGTLVRYVEYEYDENGNLIGFTDLDGKKTVYSYYNDYKEVNGVQVFDRSRIKQIIDANGHQVVKNDYDPYGRLVRQYDGNNYVRYHSYKDVISIGADETPDSGCELVSFFIDENGFESKVEFNQVEKKPVEETDTYGNTVQHRYYIDYDSNGQWTEITDLIGSGTDYNTYLGEISQGNKPTKETIADKRDNSAQTEYDVWGNTVKITDAKNKTISMEYNAQNNITKMTDKKNNETVYTYYDGIKLQSITDSIYNVTAYEYYDPGPGIVIRGLVKKVTENLMADNENLITFKTTEYKYEDGYNNRTQVIDSMGNITNEIYDVAGRLKQTTDPKNNITKYYYDNMNRLISVEDPNGNCPSIQYDNVGNKRFVTDKNGNATEYIYDGENQLIKIIDPVGNQTVIKYDGLGNKLEENVANRSVTAYDYDGLGRMDIVTDSLCNSTEMEYDANGNTVTVTDALHRVTTYEYDELNRKTREIQPLGKITEYTYDENDNILTITDTSGKITQYEYDELNRKTKVTDGVGLVDGQEVSMEVETTYNYDVYVNEQGEKFFTVTETDNLNHSMTKEYNAPGQLKKVTDAKGNSVTYDYDSAGNLIIETDARLYSTVKDYDALNRVIRVTDALNNQVNYEYDPAGNTTAQIDAKGSRTEYSYDKMNRLNAVTDPYGNTTSYSYDELGNRKTVTDAMGNTVTYYYDAVSRLKAEKDAEGHTSYITYDAVGNKEMVTGKKECLSTDPYAYLIEREDGTFGYYYAVKYSYDDLDRLDKVYNQKRLEIEDNEYDLMGNLLSREDGNGNVTTYEYDSMHRLTRAVYPGDTSIDQNTVEYKYNILGQLIWQKNSVDTVDTYDYDELGRLQSSTQTLQGDYTQSITTSCTYDENGNKLTETDANETTTTYTYDELNRLSTSSITVSEIEQTTANTYDANGNIETRTDWRNNTITYIYDSLNRLVQKNDPYGKAVQRLEYYRNGAQSKSYDALNNVAQFFYDKNNRLIRTADPELHETSQTYDEDGNIKTKTDGRGKTTTYAYDETGNLKSVTNAKNEIYQYTYDNNGNMLTQMDGIGNTVTMEYNVANKISKRIDHGGIGVPAKTESYTYYADGNLKTETDRNGNTLTYTYDCHGRITSKTVGEISITFTYDGNGNQLTVSDATGTTTRTYDELDRVLTKNVPVIGLVTYTYDITSGMEEGCTAETSNDPKGNLTTKVYDRAGRIKTVTVDGQTTAYSYYDDGNVQNVVYPNGIREEYTYFGNNRLKTLINRKSDGTEMDSYTYAYDKANNMTSKYEVINCSVKGKTSYTYDVLNRLVTVEEPDGKMTAYDFDAAGNRSFTYIMDGSNLTVTAYMYNEQNRLTNITTRLNSRVIEVDTYTFDNNGNQIQSIRTPYINGVPQTPIIAQSGFDKLNRMISYVSGGTTTNYTFNGEDLRVAKSVNGSLTRYLYEYDKVVSEYDALNNQTARNVYGTNLLARTVGGQTYYYMYNGHADVTALLNAATGSIDATYYYDAFGNIIEQTGSVNNSITYAGYQYDSETGLYYCNARMYDPVTARFLQEDTYTGDSNDPLSLNLYTYCHNEPIMYTDPSGHSAIIPYTDRNGIIHYYTEQEMARRENWDTADYMKYSVYNYKNSNESQKLTNAGQILYQGKGKFDFDKLDDLGYGFINGTQTIETTNLNRDLNNFKENVATYKSVLEGKTNLSDAQLREVLRNISGGYDYFNGILGIDFDENFNPIENENLYFAYGVRTVHSWDFENSLINSDVGAGFEGVAQGHRIAQMAMSIAGGMGLKNSFSGKVVPSESDAAISKLDFIERNGVKPAPTNYVKPTIVEQYEETGRRKLTLNRNFTGKFTAKGTGNTGANNVVNYAKYKEVLRTTEAANPLVDSLKQTGDLPSNYITKAQAEALGWKPGKALGNYAPGKQIGGDVFENTSGVLPSTPGRVWYEADVGLTNTMTRAKQPGTRLLYSNDGQLYVTYDHYETVHNVGTWK